MKKAFLLNPASHKIKDIHTDKDTSIVIHSIKNKNDEWSKNTLVKLQKLIDGHGQRDIRKYRGFTLDDMVIIKRNWPTILKSLASQISK